MFDKIINQLIEAFSSIGINTSRNNFDIDNKHCDIACNVAFKLAKEQKRNPNEIALEIVEKLQKNLPEFIDKVEVKGGFINFFLNYSKLSEKLLREIIKKGEDYGREFDKNEKVVIDYSCPNPGKPMHFGHIRSTIIGDCLARIFEFKGYNVIRSNYLNDRGAHMGKLLLAIEKYGLKDLDSIENPEKYLLDLYVKITKEIKENSELENKVKEYIALIDKKDPRVIELLNKIVEISWKGFCEVYDILDVCFDEVIRETEIVDYGIQLVKECLKKGIAVKEKTGEVVAKLEEYGIPNTVILRSNGTPLYITTDMGLAFYRYQKHKFDKCLYIVATEQSLHFKQLFKIMELLGYSWIKNCIHVGFGLLLLESGKMSTREGRVIFLKDVIEEVIQKAKEELKKRGKEDENLARNIGIAAIKYSILSVENKKDIVFDIKRMLNFDGKTGPYLLYSYVRAKSILRKAGEFDLEYNNNEIVSEEKELIKLLAKFSIIIDKVIKTYEPYILAVYLYELAKKFTEFYHNCQVLGSEKENFRLTLVKTFSIVMKIGLNLLGIKVVEEM